MSTKTLAALFCSAFAISVFAPSAPGQNLSGSSLDISGTATIGTLVSGTASASQLTSGSAAFDVLNITGSANFQNGISISGTTDIVGNTALFGAWSGDAGTPGVIITYGDGINGVGANFALQATRPGSVWNWVRTTSSGSAVTVMQIDSANRLILTGTAGANPPQVILDPNGSITVSGGTGLSLGGNVTISGGSSLTLPDGTVLSSSNTLSSVIAAGTVATMSGTISASQVDGLAPVATGGNLDYSKVANAPTNVSAFNNDAGYVAASGTVANMVLSGTTKVAGGIVVTGTLDSSSNVIVASGTMQMLLVPQQGDLSMGSFAAGAKPQ